MSMKLRGGPSPAEIEQARNFSQTLGEKGDILLFKGKKKGECAALFNQLAKSIAVLAFCPGGIKLFGQHWKARPEDP